jgi:hypothetical protein
MQSKVKQSTKSALCVRHGRKIFPAHIGEMKQYILKTGEVEH